MRKPVRVGWAGKISFDEKQISELTSILRRRKADQVVNFLKSVEALASLFLSDWRTAGNVRPEPSSATIDVLRTVAKAAKALEKALQKLDSTGSEVFLAHALSRLKNESGDTIYYLKHDLPLLRLCAESAADGVVAQPAGRSPDLVERQFIAAVGRSYVECFNRPPSHSRDTEFTKFIAKVLEFALPDNPHSAFDNSKIVTAALKSAGIIT